MAEGKEGFLRSAYFGLEDRYYSLIDFLNDKLHLPVVDFFVNPIESRGLPSFPFFAALCLLIVGAVAFFVFPSFGVWGATTSLEVQVLSGTTPIDGADVALWRDGNSFASVKTRDGTALFSEVPLQGDYSIRVSKTGFETLVQEVVLSGEAASLTASLRALAVPSATPRPAFNFIVNVADSAGTPVSGALVSYSSPSAGGDSGRRITDATGQAVLALSKQDQILMLSVSADGFVDGSKAVQSRQAYAYLTLLSASETRFQDNGDSSDTTSGDYNDYSLPVAVDVRVFVKDQQDNPVPCTVTLYDSDTGEALDSDRQSSGAFNFPSRVYSGSYVYVLVQPDDSEAFLEYTSGEQQAIAGTTMEFEVALEEKTIASSRDISVIVKDEEGNGVSYAAVELFSDSTNSKISSTSTDSEGNASFSISSDVELSSFYATAFAEDFLPSNIIVSSSSVTLVLKRVLAGNNAAFEAEVSNLDKQAVSGAKTVLYDENGRFFGAPVVESDLNGFAQFHQMPVNKQLRAKAKYRSQVGSSDIFVLSAADEERVVPIILSQATGSIKFVVKDIATLLPIGGASVQLQVDGEKHGSCTTSDGRCAIDSADAGKEFTARIIAPGYAVLSSESFAVSAEATLEKTFFLVPSSLANQTRVFLTQVTDEQDNDVTANEVLGKAGYYNFKIVASFPLSTERQGVFVRVGDLQNAAEEKTVLTSVDYSPSEIAQSIIAKGTSYKETLDASTDLLSSPESGAEFKWAYVEYDGLVGSAELSAKVFVKPTAKQQDDQVKVYYRAWTRIAGVFDRSPLDDVLSTNERSQGRDSLYAKSNAKTYGVSDGKYYCNPSGTACVAISFSTLNNPIGIPSPFKSTLGERFRINYEVRSFAPIEASQAFVRIASPEQLLRFGAFDGQGNLVRTTDYDARILLGSRGPTFSGSLEAEGIAPAALARLQVEFGDARGPIFTTADPFAIIEGKGRLLITELSPSTFETGKKKDLRIRILSGTQIPITNARISLEENDDSVDGAPFAGEPPAPIVGDNSEDNGLDGYYKISKIRTKSPGVFTLRVRRDGYAETTEELTSTTTEFLSFTPDEGIEAECKGTQTTIENILDTSLDVIATVGPGETDAPCAEITGIGVSKTSSDAGETAYSIKKLGAGKTKRLRIIPSAPGDCTVSFSSRDARTSANYYIEYEVSNLCNEYASNTTASLNATISTKEYFYAKDGVWYDYSGGSNPARVLVNATEVNEDGSEAVNVSVSFQNQDSLAHAFQCKNRVGRVVFQATTEQFTPGAVVIGTFTKAGLFKCKLENGNEARLKIKSLCPHHSWSYYSGFLAACLVREGLLRNTPVGDIVNYGASAWEVAASIPYHLDAAAGFRPLTATQAQASYSQIQTQFQNPQANVQAGSYYNPNQQQGYNQYPQNQPYSQTPVQQGTGYQAVTQAAYSTPSNSQQYIAETSTTCTPVSGGTRCIIKINPAMRFGGAAIAIDNVNTNYLQYLRVGQANQRFEATTAEGTVSRGNANECFQFLDLDSGSSRIGTSLDQAVQSAGIPAQVPLARSFAFLFNPEDNDDCINYVYENGKLYAEPAFTSGTWVLMTGVGSSHRITLEVQRMTDADDPAAPYYVMAVPAAGKVSYRSQTQNSIEPVFIVNNIAGKDITVEGSFLDEDGQQLTETTLGGRGNDRAAVFLQPLAMQAPSSTGETTPVIPLTLTRIGTQELTTSEDSPNQNRLTLATAERVATTPASSALLNYDVIGSVGKVTNPSDATAANSISLPALQCSGTFFCKASDAQNAYNDFKNDAETSIGTAYSYVPFVYRRSMGGGLDQAFETCIGVLGNEMIADRASEALCKTFFKACNSDAYDEEEEEIEEGEEEHLDWSAIGASAGNALKTTFCQGTQMGQNLQAMESMFGDQRTREVLRQALGRVLNAGNFRTPELRPLLNIQERTPYFFNIIKTAEPVNGDADVGRGIKLVEVSVNPDEINQLLQSQVRGRDEDLTIVYEERGLFAPRARTSGSSSTTIGGATYRALQAPFRAADTAIRHAIDTPNVDYAFPYLKWTAVEGNTPAHYTIAFSDAPNLAVLNKFKLVAAPATAGTETQDALEIAAHLNGLRAMSANARLSDEDALRVKSATNTELTAPTWAITGGNPFVYVKFYSERSHDYLNVTINNSNLANVAKNLLAFYADEKRSATGLEECTITFKPDDPREVVASCPTTPELVDETQEPPEEAEEATQGEEASDAEPAVPPAVEASVPAPPATPTGGVTSVYQIATQANIDRICTSNQVCYGLSVPSDCINTCGSNLPAGMQASNIVEECTLRCAARATTNERMACAVRCNLLASPVPTCSLTSTTTANQYTITLNPAQPATANRRELVQTTTTNTVIATLGTTNTVALTGYTATTPVYLRFVRATTSPTPQDYAARVLQCVLSNS